MDDIDLQTLDPLWDVKILRDRYSVRRREHKAIWGKVTTGDGLPFDERMSHKDVVMFNVMLIKIGF